MHSRQEKLLENRNTLQAVIDGIGHPIYTIDEQWLLVSVNKNKKAELPSPAGVLAGKLCFRVFFDRNAPCEHCQANAILDGDSSRRWTVKWAGSDLRPQEWDVSAYPVPGSDTGSARAVIVWQDRTEERRLGNSLIQAGKLAAIGQLAAGVAHEINNPLTAINANTEMLRMTLPNDSESRESLELISKAGERATQVVQGLLDFARQGQYEFAPADINDSVLQALNLVAYQMTTANIELDVDLADDLPAVEGSWDHLQSVWLNMLMNARDALLEEPGARKIEVATRFNSATGAIRVVILDNGRGMSEVEQEHIFQPFYTTKATGQGTGLGLATSHQIVEQHGGQIEVISTLGKGTAFIVHLPLNHIASPAI
jgi:two-component system NtrC family sensor kinase